MTEQSYSRTAMLLHWLIAAALAFQIGMGARMDELSPGQGLYDLVQLHKSIGISILLLTLLRLTVRYFKPPPPPITDEVWALFLSKWTHVALYTFMIGAPLTGWIIVSTSKLGIDTILFGSVAWPHVPGLTSLAADTKHMVHELAENAHEKLAWLGIALFVLHVAGALRHQFMKSEPLLVRMLPFAALSKRVAGTIGILGLAAVLFVTFGIAKTLGGDDPKNVAETENIIVAEKAIQPVPLDKNAEDEQVDAKPDLPIESGAESSKETIEEKPEKETVEITEKQSPKADNPTKQAISNGPYRWVITRKTPIKFSVKWNGNATKGSFANWDANIKFSPDALDASSIKVTVSLASVGAEDASILDALKGSDFFDVKSAASASFNSTSITSDGGNRFVADGILKLKNISRPTRLSFALDIDGKIAAAKGSAKISRSAFKIGEGDYAEIADDVSIDFDFSAARD